MESIKRTIIIHPHIKAREKSNVRSVQSKLEEARGLAAAIELEVVLAEVVSINRVTPSTYIGSGKVEELAEFIKSNGIQLMIFNDALGPVQHRNLETELNCKVIDRTALILEIFGQRASTKEGNLQVELAAQEYQRTRLVRSWTHLERQRGGSGFLGGPGETQIESDRRAIRDRIALIKKRLNKVVQTREIQRKARKKVPYEVVALVGYTNAGKSTLFNKLTGANVVAEDKLFATLDPTMRVIKLPSGRRVILSDTVGFISELPTELVAAFRATLEEVVEANIVLHVRDIANEESEEQKKDVEAVLVSLGMEKQMHNNMLEVLNKVDMLPEQDARMLMDGRENAVAISAVTGKGIADLLKAIDKMLAKNSHVMEVDIPCGNGQVIAWLYANAEVLDEEEADGVMHFTVNILEQNVGRLRRLMGEDTTPKPDWL